MIYAIGWLLAFMGAGVLVAGVTKQNVLTELETVITTKSLNASSGNSVNPYLATSKSALDNVPGAVGSNVQVLPDIYPPEPVALIHPSSPSNFHLRNIGG